MPIDELRHLAEYLRDVDAAAAAADWDHDGALMRAEARARNELAAGGVGADIAAAGADPFWLARAREQARAVSTSPRSPAPGAQADANAVVAVGLARAAVAEAVLAVAASRRTASATAVTQVRGAGVGRFAGRMRALGVSVLAEVRHLLADKPRSVLARVVITLAIALSLVSFYHFTGLTRYDDAGRLTLYLFAAVVGSVICTNALCFEAERVRVMLQSGDRLWRILVSKNLAMAALVTLAGLPVIVFLSMTADVNPVAMVDQLVTMVFIWLGVGNVLSVVAPLRHEPVSARWTDGTWKPYLLSFGVSYGVGLTVNLMIYWRLWAKQKASAELAGGTWAAFALVLASAVLSWLLLTVFAVACSRDTGLRRRLSREMVVYRKAS
ncbi:ABC transporter permease [Mycolicibacterium hippocampi]|uniref:Uncharacterized protein n=1 Tax=Mycolicibacterium hippocampi TaxID=659824 RepID=A0A850PWJ6_9MYCO|nr:ABC transporter permease [Mycolicibacterium hippocampi]NVN52015.1 hypothetical protein [Mycolicibacterium hippocampi]